ncbi:hypothetical protein COCMIDRAFT_108401 [Bipolaris oryzae ATCC 44560]|uniref:EF-hand domain-containing protein n=1 Tax=Bipolaris oryzae ATCC 44560 TaxID=930090 RepID=W6ZA40_COCMI|nr:uncharacterized protein COCMIDRAFT_108401 [Bipolaris oryzae ATCC 44560]EUC40581.1 hypothetical protein COCMIDRAFT_108401 [Bipolaris oryzae ATCC 44560]
MDSTTPTPYKPSPLSFNNARQSPFRRPGSIREASPSTLRPSTPNTSPLKPKDTPNTPSQANLRPTAAAAAPATATGPPSQNPPPWLHTRTRSGTPEPPASPGRHVSPTRNAPPPTAQGTGRPLSTASIAAMFEGTAKDDTPAPLSFRKQSPPVDPVKPVERPIEKPVEIHVDRFAHLSPAPSPARSPARSREPSPGRLAARPPTIRRMASSDALSKLPPPLLHSMRESFSVMDRDDDGHVNAADVADMLSQLGLSATPSQLSTYFNGAQSINLANYLTTLSDLLGNLSHQNELSAAFEAFDDNDDGQIDLAELKDALLHTAPQPGETLLTEREINMVVEGFSGRRAFGKGGKGLGRGEVFRYHDFLANLTGGGNGGDNAEGTAASA